MITNTFYRSFKLIPIIHLLMIKIKKDNFVLITQCKTDDNIILLLIRKSFVLYFESFAFIHQKYECIRERNIFFLTYENELNVLSYIK